VDRPPEGRLGLGQDKTLVCRFWLPALDKGQGRALISSRCRTSFDHFVPASREKGAFFSFCLGEFVVSAMAAN
jgi:hypothetical protein